jgi:hypothetical protein
MMKSRKAISSRLFYLIVVIIVVAVAAAAMIPIGKRAFGKEGSMGLLDNVWAYLGLGEKTSQSKLDPKQYSAEVEFEEDTLFRSNVYYRFKSGQWVWKWPNTYKNYMPLDHEGVDSMNSQYQRITKGLANKDLAQGAEWLQNEINNDDDGYLILHYTNGCAITTTDNKNIKITNLHDWIKDPNEPIKFSQSGIVESTSGCTKG